MYVPGLFSLGVKCAFYGVTRRKYQNGWLTESKPVSPAACSAADGRAADEGMAEAPRPRSPPATGFPAALGDSAPHVGADPARHRPLADALPSGPKVSCQLPKRVKKFTLGRTPFKGRKGYKGYLI